MRKSRVALRLQTQPEKCEERRRAVEPLVRCGTNFLARELSATAWKQMHIQGAHGRRSLQHAREFVGHERDRGAASARGGQPLSRSAPGDERARSSLRGCGS